MIQQVLESTVPIAGTQFPLLSVIFLAIAAGFALAFFVSVVGSIAPPLRISPFMFLANLEAAKKQIAII